MLIRLKAKRNESMELDERKVRILKAIVSNYLETGEPVGSRTISKLADMNVSPATIRNEMSDLEDMGYICQPHASAGRVPTVTGFMLTASWQTGMKRKQRIRQSERIC